MPARYPAAARRQVIALARAGIRADEDRDGEGFRNFLLQGELIIIAVGLVLALAFSTLIKSFTDNVITPLIDAAAGGKGSSGLGGTVNHHRGQHEVARPGRVRRAPADEELQAI